MEACCLIFGQNLHILKFLSSLTLYDNEIGVKYL